MDHPVSDELFGRYHRDIHRYLSRMSGQSEVADDLSQEVFLRALQASGNGHGATGHERGWMFSIARGGQQQRVAVARALVGEPAILLADEPTGNLDSRNGEAVMELLGELHAGGATICMVTHDPRFARSADTTVHLFDGRVVEESVEATA